MVETKRFDVTVALDPTDAELRPEMTARIDIRVGERRDVVRLPVNALFGRNRLTMVNVLHGGRVETRQIEMGEQNQRYVEVLEGVAAGERVMLVGEPAVGDAPPAMIEPAGALDALARGPL
jgi:multidrug efflux pump subunit AcrA (membrane-fusion protein)